MNRTPNSQNPSADGSYEVQQSSSHMNSQIKSEQLDQGSQMSPYPQQSQQYHYGTGPTLHTFLKTDSNDSISSGYQLHQSTDAHQHQPHQHPQQQSQSQHMYRTSSNPQYQYQEQQNLQPIFQQQQGHHRSQQSYQFDYTPPLSIHSHPSSRASQQQRLMPAANVPTYQPFIPQPQLQQQIPQEGTSSANTSNKSSLPQKRKKTRKQDNTLPTDQGESELKQLALKTRDVPLSELAINIKQLENETINMVPQAGTNEQFKAKENKERQRQLFGMVWLLNACDASPTAVVPRNRIYARYVQICADNGLSPLSPASFGKLVRILFPNLTTRRLGMRGQSKYHYCGIKLNGDQNIQSLTQSHEQHQSQYQQQQLLSGFTNQQVHSPISSTNSSISFDDSPVSASDIHTPSYTPINSPSIITPTISDQLPSISHMKYIPNLFKLLNSNAASSSDPYTAIQLPSIYPYLPRDTDYDIADTLHSLYKVHVNAIFESLRFMQLKKLLASFNNFNSILTAPVFKLYTNECIIEWVKQCDLLMYKKMIRMLNKLQLQFMIPDEQLRQLKQISNGYIKTLSTTLMNSKVSKNFVIMKLKLAKHFVNLLNRLIKVIETGQPASRILNDPTEKQSMLQDWSKLDIHELISRELPCSERNIEILASILNSEIVEMINEKKENTGPTMFDFADYVTNLPGRFPEINSRLFILLASNLLTACLREISLSGGEGFGAWWIVRCWVDEYLAWTVELGGFFQDDFKSMEPEGLHIERRSDDIPQQGSPTQPPFQSFHNDMSKISEQSEPNRSTNNITNMSGFDNSLGAIDLLDTSLDFDSRDPPLGITMNTQQSTEGLLHYENHVSHISNQ
ncbi:RFX [[Candida] subhashii]|uniref:RFX n=1 Tax=[Candida] subhashii TaxID=561895 RepID=A0A8J5UV67_9ASCO|nr:RFX [[Candida] subhashii]KAG7666317.1 RFX [[Candida] subhashii]